MTKTNVTPAEWAKVISAQFNQELAKDLTPEQLEQCRALNGTRAYPVPDVCPTHDFIDANEAMCEAFIKVLGFEPDIMNDEHNDLWAEAWRLSRVNNYKN